MGQRSAGRSAQLVEGGAAKIEKDSSLLWGQDEPETQWVSKWDPWRGS